MLPLHQAIEQMDEQKVAALLQAGADPNQPDPELAGFMPLHLALDIESEDSCNRYDMGDKEARPRASLTRLLVKAGANPDLPDGSGITARMIARERMHAEALEIFAEKT